MKTLFRLIFTMLGSIALCCTAAVNIINIVVLENMHLTLNWSLLEYDSRIIPGILLVNLVLLLLMLSAQTSKSAKKKMDDDQKNFSHLSSVYEAKKGLTRIQFHKVHGRWVLRTASKLSLLDRLLNPAKKMLNGILTFLRVNDCHKFNTVKTWSIGGEDKTMRAGLPVYMPRFRKKTMFLEANDVHNLVVGTTNSGKTVSLMLQMIETVRMAGESGIINDPKGELYEYTAKQFKEDGYEVIRLNFVNPQAGDDWGVLMFAWSEWKKAYDKYEQELKEWNDHGMGMQSSEKAVWLSRRPEPDYSAAIEYLTDMAEILTYEAKTNDPFWNDSAKELIVGMAAYLMEECVLNKQHPEDVVNFKSIKMMVDMGDEALSKEQMKMLNVSSKNVLGALLEKTRKPDDASRTRLQDYCDTSEQTRRSIKKVFNSKISMLVMNEQIVRMTSRSSFRLEDLGNKKMIIYMIVHDEKKTYYPLVSLFTKQLYETLIREARGNTGRLPVPVNIMLDEFGNCPPLKDIQSMLTAGRSRGVRFTLLVQDTAQLEEIYGEHTSQTIQNNCSNTVYILGSQPDTLKNFSAMCGNRQVWLPARNMYESRPLISVDRLQHMNLGEVVIHRQRKAPFITRMIPYDRCRFYHGKHADPNDLLPPKKKVAWLNPKELLSVYGDVFR